MHSATLDNDDFNPSDTARNRRRTDAIYTDLTFRQAPAHGYTHSRNCS